ncbi:S6 family peptidase [Campylobacter upsaliensis]|uniref:Anti-codon nuclease masking agent n=1 Tax=Campylobacter upsaliensis TaxID=28080 RepID=A0A448KPB8_CAMUP|nr:S6 family peptidase [Campylobacter upsaliensis]MCA5588999.1 autotransporter domain-containing protein [Campylobacter upsaliensis]VEG85240.1 anti-codon nuclease masking agent [Campylobacter upsaliensis]
MKTRAFLLSVAVAQSLYAMNVDKNNFYTRDYLDFGQNLGQFTPGATNLSIIKKDGSKVALPDLPFPDFSKFNGANKTSVGGAYMASAKHIVHPNGRPIVLDSNIKLGDSSYADKQVTTYANDSAYTRVNKFIVEGGYKVISFNDLKKNAANYMTHYKDEERIIIYRSGDGIMSFQHWDGSPNAKEMVRTGARAGNLFYIKPSDIGSNQLVVRPNGNHYGPLKGVINSGDSGSPIFVFNKTTQEWEIVGTTHGGTPSGQKVANTFWAITDPNQLDSFKKQFEKERVANGGTYQNEQNKDSVYNDSGTITINDAVNQGIGGIILRGDNKTLEISGSGSFAGAGIDIVEENSKVVWNTGVSGDLHKIGKGELEVTKQTNGKLRMGEGVVRLKAENSFSEVHLANRDGRLIIDNDKATDYNKLNFGKSGGILDLNGHSVSMSGVKAYNSNAMITNENKNQISTLNLNNSNKTIIHANISGNTNIQIGNSTLSAKNNASPTNREIIFDGGFDIGTLNGSNQHIVLQGKPVPHATWKGGCAQPAFLGICEVGHYIDKYDRNKANQMGQGHKVINQTVTFNQPDWIQRGYKGNITLDNGSKLFIERNANVSGDITLNNGSTLTLNSKTLYIDSGDSKSLQQSIQSQSLSADVKDTITYQGNLKASQGSTITSQGIKQFSASVDLNKATLTASNDEITLLERGLKLENEAKLTAKSLHIKDTNNAISVDEKSQLSIDELKIENSTVSLNTQNKNLGKTINVNSSTLNVADGSKIPQNVNLKASTLAFDNLNSTFSLNGSKFDDTSRLRAKNLSHKQNDNITWKDNNVKHIDITEALKLSDVGSGVGDKKFLALKLEDMQMKFEKDGEVLVSFAKDLNKDSVEIGREYDMLLLKKLITQDNFLVRFEGQDSNSKVQALATKTDTGIKLSFTKDNQVNANDIMNTIGNRANYHQLFLLNDLIAANPNHPLVLDVAFNRNNTSAINRIVARIQKVDDDAKDIAKTLSQSANLQQINHHNKITSKRINSIKINNLRASNEIGSYLYASLASDVPLVYPMSNDYLANNMWINTGGGYFEGSGYLKYFNTNIGYDRQFSFDENDMILGAFVSFGRSYADNGGYNDNVNNYGFGLYSALTHNAHELQVNANYIIGKSKKYNDLATAKMTDYSFGVSGIYKYAFELNENQAIKPILGLEYVVNQMAGYTLDIMKIADYDYRALNGILGAEYAYINENLFFSAGISGKKAIHSSNDKIRIGIDGSNRFIGYDLQGDKVTYNLDLMTDYKINNALTLGINANFQTTFRGESGASGLFKAEYHF